MRSSLGEEGALLRRQPPGSKHACHVLLLERLPDVDQRRRRGIYYRAFLTWDDGKFEYDPAFLLVPFASGFSVVVDPRKGCVPQERELSGKM